MLPARLVVVEMHDRGHGVRLAVPDGRQRQGEEQVRKPGSSTKPDAAPRQGDTALQVLRRLMVSQLFQSLTDLSRQGGLNGRVEAGA